MLAHLSIRDIVLIDRLDLSLAPGMSVLTGENRGRKIHSARCFCAGARGRGDGGLVRAGQSQGQVTASFDLAADHPARELARANGLDGDGDMILRRLQSSDGKTPRLRHRSAVSVAVLRALGETLVEIHGQHDDRALIDPARHRAILDAFGGLDRDVAAVAEAHRALRQLREELAERRAEVEAARKEEEYPPPRLRRARQARGAGGRGRGTGRPSPIHDGVEKIAGDLTEAFQSVGGDHSPVSQLAGALRKLERRAAQAPTSSNPA